MLLADDKTDYVNLMKAKIEKGKKMGLMLNILKMVASSSTLN